jgi:competence protein ComEC
MNINAQGPLRSLNRYPFLVLLPAFAAGIILQQYLKQIAPLTWIALLLLLIAALVPLLFIKSIKPQVNVARTVAIVTAFVLMGTTSGSIADVRNNRLWYGHFIESAEAIKVTISDEPLVKNKTVLLPATVEGVYVKGHWVKALGNVRLYIYRKNLSTIYSRGQTLLLPNKFTAIKSSGNPFSFDVSKQSERKDILHQAFLSPDEVDVIASKEIKQPTLGKLKRSLQNAIDENVKDSTTRALIAATLLNERSDMNEDLMAAYSNTGIVHIIAISGMHIVLLAACVLWLLNIIPSARLKTLKYTIAIVVVWLYIALTGFPPSAVRAAVMFSLAAVGICLNRLSNPVNIWGAAGLLVLCYNPYWLYDVGIQLSFLAVLSILLFYTPIKNWVSPATRAGRWLWDVVSVSIAAQILVFPLVIYYFHQFPLLSIPANVPAALYSTLLMFGALLMFIIHAIGLPAVWLGTLLSYMTKAFNAIIIFLSDYTPQLLRSIHIDVFEYWLMMLIIVIFCVACMRRQTTYLLCGIILCLLFTIDLTAKDYTVLHQQRLVVYNTSGKSQADVFIGKKVTHLYAVDSSQLKYNIGPAMAGYGVNIEKNGTIETNNLFTINRATILLLGNCDIDTSASFPIDYLVVSKKCVFSPEQWFQAFHPKKIIIDGSLPRYKAIRWKDELIAAGAQVHWVQEDGAWIYPIE